MRIPPVRARRFTRAEYDRFVETGILGEDDRVELLDGQLVVCEPQGSRHASVVVRARAALERAFGRGYHVRDHSPVALDDVSEPEPDLAVVGGDALDYRDAHPSAPLLVVEVADTSLGRDRLVKAALYARAGIREYWIINLVEGVLEVYRGPERSPAGDSTYRRVRRLGRNASISPLAASRARIPVVALLP